MATSPTRRAIDFDNESEVVPRDLPSLVVRIFAWMIILLVVAAALISFLVPFPEVIESAFVLVPKDGADPVKAPIGGSVERVEAKEGKDVKAGEVLFVINSQDLTVMDTRVKSLERELQASKPVSEAVRESRKAAMRSAEIRVSSLSSELSFMVRRKEKSEKLRKMAETSFQKNLITQEQLLREQDADDEAGRALENLRRGLAEAKSGVAEMRALSEREEAELSANTAKLEGALAEGQAALAWVQRATEESQGIIEENGRRLFRVTAPFDGTITSIGPSRPGVVIERGEVLCTLAQAGAELRAELNVPELEAGRIAREQSVKLLLDAYPYVRYGTRSAVVSWVSPTAEAGKLRAHATISDATVVIDGVPRALRAGMSGKGRVRVGNRTLVEYVLEPLRQLRENLSHEAERPKVEPAKN